MLFSGKENIFKCLVAFQKMFWKIFSGVWLCSWKYRRKHIFYLLLTFSHIFSTAKQIYNIIPQYRNTKETKPRKKIHQIWSNWEKKEERDATGLDLEARSCGGCEGEVVWWRRDRAALELIFAWSPRCNWHGTAIDETDAIWCDWYDAAIDKIGGVWVIVLELDLWSSGWSSVWGLGSLFSLSLFARESGNGLKWKFWLKPISESKPLKHTVTWK